MSLANRKAAFIAAHGDAMTIFRPSGNIETFARIVKGRQLLSPFDINFIRFMLFLRDSGVKSGDLVLNGTTNEQSFVAAAQVRTLEGALTGIYTELYVVNYQAIQILRKSKNGDGKGNPVTTWSAIATLPMNIAHVKGAESFKGQLLLQDTELVATMQTATALLIGDRFAVDSKPYKVTDINISSSPGLQFVQLATDTR